MGIEFLMRLHAENGGGELQRIGNAMIDLAHQQLRLTQLFLARSELRPQFFEFRLKGRGI
ncbi:hypothetical protein IZ6_09440 [Terrihabitans soli]|uniref:Uncharacterized protein n=1 Tax=Terrihabitans soli TaxID=708113 RepID=A0A6S6QMP2_9HYPH|nr:hypothetical protein IZ6_09440 [Terrihabitans soli]